MPLLSLLLDHLLGDPPNRFHPTAWMGNLIGWLVSFRPRGNRLAELAFGVFILIAGLLLTISAGLAVTYLAKSLPVWAEILLTALVLKLTISLKGLDKASHEVQTALEEGDLGKARHALSWHLVSRDTSNLDASRVSAAAIESVAENASDGIVAPLIFFALGGLPGAFAYRFVNTADSMLGYHDEEREWLGKVPARLDDVLNFIPARLTGVCLLLAAPLVGANVRQGWKILWRDASQTDSPNAGIPMSAMAGALGVELEKMGSYILGKGLRQPSAVDLARARRLLVVGIGIAAIILTLWSIHVQPH